VAKEDLKSFIAEANEDMLFADGFDEALVGYIELAGSHNVALYDRDKCIQILMDDHGMDDEEAIEYFDYNVTGAYMGPNTPAFATFLTEDDI
jgi:hypothetical protein